MAVLTVLGFAIGTGALIATISLSVGGSALLEYEMSRLGTDCIWVSVEEGSALSKTDVGYILRTHPQTQASAVQSSYAQLESDRSETLVQLIGCQESYCQIAKLQVAQGRFINENDDERALMAAVLDSALAEDLFGEEDALGQSVFISGVECKVVGVVSELPSGFVAMQEIRNVYLSIAAYERVTGIAEFDQIAVGVHENIGDVAQSIVDGLGRLNNAVYSAATLEGEIEISRRIMHIFVLVVGSIGAICMLVGGIGIMNMMVCAVRERRREIGVMLAIGASPGQIFRLFLTETMMLCLLGGIFGLALGLALTYAGCLAVDMELFIPLWALTLPVCFGLCVGLFFGIAPAVRASRTSPIDAIRN